MGALFAKVRRLNKEAKSLRDEQWHVTFLRANDAVRIAYAIEEALGDPGSKEAIHRIIRSDMNLSTRQISRGKDSLWELDLYRRLKLGGSAVRFDEPDLVVSLGDTLGDYAVACKKIYSERNVAESFSDGCNQILTHGRPGIVAINLDDLLPEDSVWIEPNRSALQSRLEKWNETFIAKNKEHFSKPVERGDCDGVLVYTSLISHVPDMSPQINVTRSSAIWNEGASPAAKLRCNAFLACLDRVLQQNPNCTERGRTQSVAPDVSASKP